MNTEIISVGAKVQYLQYGFIQSGEVINRWPLADSHGSRYDIRRDEGDHIAHNISRDDIAVNLEELEKIAQENKSLAITKLRHFENILYNIESETTA